MRTAIELNQNDFEVLRTLTQSHQPLSAYGILNALREAGKVRIKAPTQIYRSLEKLMSRGEVHRIASINAFVACSCEHEGAPPGFFVCLQCGAVAEFDARGAADVPAAAGNGFKVQSMNLELSGLCLRCQEAASAA